LQTGKAQRLILADARRGYGPSNFADGVFNGLLNPEAAPGVWADISLHDHAGIGRYKVHAVCAFLVAFRFILVFCLRFIHLAGLGKAETR
jgi:hypothetical protein